MNSYYFKINLTIAMLIALFLLSPAFGFPWDNNSWDNKTDKIPWGDNLRKAQEISRQTGKPVLLHFFSDTCPPCKMMEKSTFPNQAISQTVQNSFIPVKLNVKHYPREAQMFNVQGVPMDIVLMPDGHQIQMAFGGQDANRYSRFLETALIAAKQYTARNGNADQVGTASISGHNVNHNPPADPSLYGNNPVPGSDSLPPLPEFPEPPVQNPSLSENPVGAPPKIEAGGACPIHESPSFDYASIPEADRAIIEYEGYCPVELGQRSMWVRGDYNNRLLFEGRLYFFAGKAQMEEFKRNPEKYVPAFNGDDPVILKERGLHVHGSRVYGAWAVGRVFLFSSEENLIKFEQKPLEYIPENLRKPRGVRP